MEVETDKENAGPGAPRAFSPGELKNMLGQCLKMASENKITPQNTWALPLIEHLPELIREEGGQQTNFQRASVTLDAGVKIYSYRVDSVHTETFKILGGLGRASNDAEDEPEGELGDGGVDDGEDAGRRRRRSHELNPEATLEASLEALNIKKFDLAFTVDPLFQKTSAQFDEGGAKGLLLNNLSVYCGCNIAFDSADVPERALDSAPAADPHAMVSLAGLRAQLDALQLAAGDSRISPTLDSILELLEEAPAADAAAEAEAFVAAVVATADSAPPLAWALPGAALLGADGDAQAADGDDEGRGEERETSMEGVAAEYAHAAAPEPADADYYDDGGGGDDYYSDVEDGGQHSAAFGGGDAGAASAEQGGVTQAASRSEPLGEDALQWLIEAGSNGMVTRARGWAGASHWRYRAVPQPIAEEEEGGGEGGAKTKKKSAARRKNDPLDFVALMEDAQQEGATAAAEPEFDLLPQSGRRTRRAKPAAKTLLPEDHHYKVENLNRYALRPRTAIIAAPAPTEAEAEGGPGSGEAPPFDDGEGFGDDGGFDNGDDDGGGDGGFDGDWGDLGEAFSGMAGASGQDLDMVQAARRVERVEVNYSRAAKQVDVRGLKELMWSGIHSAAPPSPDSVLQFQDVLATVPEHNSAGRLEDLSVHLCFICVLHLANEHGLVIQDVPGLDQLRISNIPRQPQDE